MSIVLVLVGVAALGAVAVVLAGRTGGQAEFAPDRAPFDLPEAAELEPGHLDRLRFAVGFRGYRMDQVDEVLDRVSVVLAERDRRIAELEGAADGSVPDDDAEVRTVAVGASSDAVVQALVRDPEADVTGGAADPDGDDARTDPS